MKRQAQDLAPRALTAAIVSSLVAFPLLISLPGFLFLSNLHEFTLTLGDLFAFVLPVFLASIGGLTALLLWTKGRPHKSFVSFLAVLGILIWIQGNFLVWQYGPLDGRQIPWAEHWPKGVLDGLVWAALLALGFWRSSNLYRYARPLAVTLLSVQFLTLLVTVFIPREQEVSEGMKDYVIEYTNKFNFSFDRNVIILVLDEYQSDVFYETVSSEKDFAEIFEGFTYFRNAAAGSNFTELAIPALLTGQLFDNTMPRAQFMRSAFLGHSIPRTLKRHGYSVDLFPWEGWGNESIYFDEQLASNLRRLEEGFRPGQTFTEKKAKEVLHLFDLALFRSAPHFLKKHIHNDQRWLVLPVVSRLAPDQLKRSLSTDEEFATDAFLAEALPGLRATHQPPTFKYYHLKGAHPPLNVDANLESTFRSLPYGRDNYVAQAKASLLSVGRFLEELKQNDVFDNSLIFIVGDHGSGWSDDMYVQPSRGTDSASYKGRWGADRNFLKDKARGIPLILVKRLGSTGPLAVSEAPVSLMDLPATVFSELDIEESASGEPMFEVGTDDRRIRHYGAFEYSANTAEFVGPIVLYSIRGHSWLDDSWHVERVNAPPG